jgi:hypothetical protein
VPYDGRVGEVPGGRRGREGCRYFVSSRSPELLTAEQWLYLVRAHWGVENQNHHTLDTAFAEDDRPWIVADAHGMLAVLLLRRIAPTLLALFRAVTLRSDENRATRWLVLLRWMRDALVALADHYRGGQPGFRVASNQVKRPSSPRCRSSPRG